MFVVVSIFIPLCGTKDQATMGRSFGHQIVGLGRSKYNSQAHSTCFGGGGCVWSSKKSQTDTQTANEERGLTA